jgi:hypothetical protein
MNIIATGVWSCLQVHGVVEPFWLVVEDADGEVVLFHQYWLLRKSLAEEEHNLSFTVPVSEPLPPQYFVRMMSDRWIGCEATLAVSFRCGVGLRRWPTVVTPGTQGCIKTCVTCGCAKQMASNVKQAHMPLVHCHLTGRL